VKRFECADGQKHHLRLFVFRLVPMLAPFISPFELVIIKYTNKFQTSILG
jgi:hypothetical protein